MQNEHTEYENATDAGGRLERLVSGTRLGAEIIDQYSIGQILGLQVRFLNSKTGRMKNGKIDQISSGAARVLDKAHVVAWVPWYDVYCR